MISNIVWDFNDLGNEVGGFVEQEGRDVRIDIGVLGRGYSVWLRDGRVLEGTPPPLYEKKFKAFAKKHKIEIYG